jgi:hypothetical protein
MIKSITVRRKRTHEVLLKVRVTKNSVIMEGPEEIMSDIVMDIRDERNRKMNWGEAAIEPVRRRKIV